MKQLTILFSLAVLLLMGSCAKEDPFSIDSGEKVIYKFTAQLPGYIDGRAIAEGECADELFFWVFDEEHHELSALRQHSISFDYTGQAQVEVPLTPGHKYSFAFWAQSKDCKVYTPSSSYVAIDYYDNDGNPYLSNDDSRDVFYAIERDIEVSTEGEMVERYVTLRRPFSQLNYGISPDAFNAIKDAGVDLTNAKTTVYVSQAYTKFGLYDGEPIEINDNWDEVEFDFNVMPSGIPNDLLHNIWWEDPDGEHSGYRDYVWLSFNYFCTTTKDYSLVDTHIEIETADGQVFRYPETGEKTIRIIGNKRTNILVDFFTADVTFNIVIDENFDDYDHIVNLTGQGVAGNSHMPGGMFNIIDKNAQQLSNRLKNGGLAHE